jgi:hypothetical protein
MAFGSNSTVRDVMENEQAKAVLEKHMPGVSSHPLLPQAWYMTLREVSMYPESGMTADKYKAIITDLEALDD